MTNSQRAVRFVWSQLLCRRAIFSVCRRWGAIGSALRYWVTRTWPASGVGFPIGTFAVNVFGSAMLGLLVGYFGSSAGPDLRLGLSVGVLGGFTTFSTFAVESGNMARGGFASTAAVYVAASVLAGRAPGTRPPTCV